MPSQKRLSETLFFHNCTLSETTIKHTKSKYQGRWSGRFLYFIKSAIVVSPINPHCFVYFRNYEAVMNCRRLALEQGLQLIHPFSKFRLYYEFYLGILFYICFVNFPYTSTFTINKLHYSTMILNFLCGIDLILTFLTGFFNKKERIVVMEFHKIAIHYVLKSTFIFDLIAVIPTELVVHQNNMPQHQWLVLLKIFKIARVKHAWDYWDLTLKYFKINNRLIHFLYKTAFFYLIFHWVACLVCLTPQLRHMITGEYAPPSVSYWHFEDDYKFDPYIKSFYYASSFLLCVRSQAWLNRIWEEYFVSLLCRTFGKLLVLLMTVILVPRVLSFSILELKYYSIKEQLYGFMFKKQLPEVLRDKLNANYYYKYRGVFFQENEISGMLSDQLKRDINSEVLSNLAQNVTLFRSLPSKVLEVILSHLKLQIYLPNDLIIKSGVYGDCMYFISSGTVSVTSPSGKEICHLSDGDFFGEICLLFKDKKRTASVLALEFCEVYKLSKNIFKTCLRSNLDTLNFIKSVAKERLDITENIEEEFIKSTYEISMSL